VFDLLQFRHVWVKFLSVSWTNKTT